MKKGTTRKVMLLITTVVLGLTIALSLKGINQASLTTRNVQELQNQVIDYQRKNEDLNDRNFQLYEYVRYLETALESGGDDELTHIIDEKERFAIFAGMRDVHNAGIVIELQETKLGRMRDSVLRQFVNELSALGAQAISINDERKVATTEIRANGDEMIINGMVYDRADPFTIKSIVDPTREAYTLSFLESVKNQIVSELADEQYQITIKAEPDVFIKALSEDRIRYNIELLQPVK